MYAYQYTYTDIHRHIDTHINMYAYWYTYTQTHTQIHTYSNIHTHTHNVHRQIDTHRSRIQFKTTKPAKNLILCVALDSVQLCKLDAQDHHQPNYKKSKVKTVLIIGTKTHNIAGIDIIRA